MTLSSILGAVSLGAGAAESLLNPGQGFAATVPTGNGQAYTVSGRSVASPGVYGTSYGPQAGGSIFGLSTSSLLIIAAIVVVGIVLIMRRH